MSAYVMKRVLEGTAARRRRRRVRALAGLMAATLLGLGCSTHKLQRTPMNMETYFYISGPNFETTATHRVGRGSCFYAFFTIPLCKNPNIAAIAWAQMRAESDLDGRPKQLVNVFEDSSMRWNLFYMFYEEYYTVTADVIEYRP